MPRIITQSASEIQKLRRQQQIVWETSQPFINMITELYAITPATHRIFPDGRTETEYPEALKQQEAEIRQLMIEAIELALKTEKANQ